MESVQADLVALGRCKKMMKQTTCYGCDKPIEPEWLPEGEFIVCDECSSDTDKLSVEKLQEHLLPYKKEMVQKIIDEKMQLVTADEFLKLHKESLTAIRENDKLQEQINTAKNALTESEKMYQKQMDRFLNSEMNESARSHCESQLKLLFPAHKAYEALAAIGGDGCPAGPIGKNGSTKEELEGSGDE